MSETKEIRDKLGERYRAVHEEAMAHVREWVDNNVPPGSARGDAAQAAVAEALLQLIAKRDERIEALERRLAALEGDAK